MTGFFKEHYATTNNGDTLYLTPVTGVVTDQTGKIRNGDTITFRRDGKRVDHTVGSFNELRRHIIGVNNHNQLKGAR